MNPTEQKKYLIDLRREKIQQLLACRMPQNHIAKALNIPVSTVDKDCQFLRKHARDYIRNYDQHMSEEICQILSFLGQLQLESWTAVKECKYEKNKASLINAARECAMAIAMLLSDTRLLDQTLVFIENFRKKKLHKLGLSDTDTTEDIADTTTEIGSESESEDEAIDDEHELEVTQSSNELI